MSLPFRGLSTTARTALAVVAVAWASAVGADGRPPAFTNPSVGPAAAPATLEYYSAVGCSACERFEVEHLPAWLREADAGRLRIVFRDVPPADPAWHDWSRTLFCQQEQTSYVAARRSTKAAGPRAEPMPAPVSAPERADRYRRCLAAPGVPAVLTFNATSLAATTRLGLPAFVWRDAQGRRVVWAGIRTRLPMADDVDRRSGR